MLLAWHYRSQHEALIQFCNKAFYKGELQTIPPVAELPKREPIQVRTADDAKVFAGVALAIFTSLILKALEETHWNRLRAAKLYERQLNERARAIEIYREIITHEVDPKRHEEAQKRLADLNGK